MNDDGMESRYYTLEPPPYQEEHEAFFESSQREFDRRGKGLDIAIVVESDDRDTNSNNNYYSSSSRYGMSS